MYQITVWKLTGKQDAKETEFECTTETYWQAIELFDCLTRGVRGHYKAWLVDLDLNKEIRMSEVSYSKG